MRQMDFDALGIQTGPFIAYSANFVLKIFHLFHFHTGRPILITPEALTGNAIGYSAILLSPSRPPALLLPPVENLFYGTG